MADKPLSGAAAQKHAQKLAAEREQAELAGSAPEAAGDAGAPSTEAEGVRVHDARKSGPDESTAAPVTAGESVTQEPFDRAQFVARSVLPTIAPSRAREEAAAARRRAEVNDPEQSAVELALAAMLEGVADKEDVRVAALRARGAAGAGSAKLVLGTPGRGPLGAPIPAEVRRGDVVSYHTDSAIPDTTALVLRLHPAVRDEDSGSLNRWRADLALFPLWGSPSTVEGAPYGYGVGQFSELPDDQDDIGRGDAGNVVSAPFRHDI